MIPKIIHQIWFQSEKNLPLKYKIFQQTWKNQPDFQYEFWDDQRIRKDILGHCSKEWFHLYDTFPTMIQKIDLAKYFILYLYGGVYIDMDVFQIGNISAFMDIHKDLNFIVFEHNTPYITITINKMLGLSGNKIINNAVIFSTAREKHMENILNDCLSKSSGKYDFISLQLRCLVTTGPVMFTNSLRRDAKLKDFCHSFEIFEPFSTLQIVAMLEKNNIHEDNHWQENHDSIINYMNFLKGNIPENPCCVVGIHVLDLSWFKKGKNNWKFRWFRRLHQMQKLVKK